MDLVIRGIDTLLTMSGGAELGMLNDAAVAMRDGTIVWVGSTHEAPAADEVIDGRGCIGLPGLVDCHTHAAWAGSRSGEFLRRLSGASYTEILEAGGGILSTVAATRDADEESLVAMTASRLTNMRTRGVTTVEVKSGYGLSPEHEARQLRVARTAGERAGVQVRTTWLGAHTVPAEHRADRDVYVRQLIDEQLPAIAGLADQADAYVDRGAFTVDEARQIFEAARDAGLGIRVHAEQVTHTGAAAMAAGLGASSADHLEHIDAAGIAAMAAAGTVGVLLPGAMLYLGDPAPPVAALRAAGVPMAVATDYNPGTSPVVDLWMAATLACITMGLTVDEALRGITVHAARALGLSDRGRLEPGLRGDMVLVRPAPGEPCTAASLVQHMGAPEVHSVIVGGNPVA